MTIRRRLLSACLAVALISAGALAAPHTASASFWTGTTYTEIKVVANTKLQASSVVCGDRYNPLYVILNGQLTGTYAPNPYVYVDVWVQNVASGSWIHTGWLSDPPNYFAKNIGVAGVTPGQNNVRIQYAVWNGSTYVTDWEYFPNYDQIQYAPNIVNGVRFPIDLRRDVGSSTCIV